MRTAIELIADERQRQIEKEGWTTEHDEEHDMDQMARAAAIYAMPEWKRDLHPFENTPKEWPWSDEWWKPTPDDRIRELVKAGALIVAEIERLQRLKL
jgi:hypothetical protein